MYVHLKVRDSIRLKFHASTPQLQHVLPVADQCRRLYGPIIFLNHTIMARSQPLGQLFQRTNWIFQAIVAGTTCVLLLAYFDIFDPYSTWYDFFTGLIAAMMAVPAGIIAIVVVRQKLPPENNTTKLVLRFEMIKSVLATALWLCVMMHALFGPSNQHAWRDARPRRIAAAVISSLLLL